MPPLSTENRPDENTSKTHLGRLVSWVLALLLILPLLYVLSLGPATVLYEKSPATRETIQTLYHPVIALITSHSFLEKPVLQYVMFWYHLAHAV